MLLWMMPDSGSNTKKDFESFIKSFKSKNPDIQVRVEYITRHNLWNKLFLMRFENSGEQMPDIIEVPHNWTPFLIATNLIENLSVLDPSLSLNKFLAPLIPHCYKAGTKDIYALPWWMDVMALHYRTDHLKRVSDDPVKDLNTWEGFLNICGKLKEEFAGDQNYFPLQNSDWRGSLSVRSILPCIWGRGSDLFAENGEKSCFNDMQFVLGMEDYITLATKNFMPVLREKGSLGTMVSGRASMFMTRRQGISLFDSKSNKLEVKTLPVPSTGGEHISFLSGINVVVNRKSTKKEEALEFIKWLMQRENQIKYSTIMEVFPSDEESFDEFIFSSPVRMQTYAKIMASARTVSTNLVTATATKILNEVLDRVASEIIKGTYTRDILLEQLYRASVEADYLLDLYGN
ncbi:ABC-type glycerol-3-phosphate transport system substrate-binding protein [Elusimicrobium simillimum]|uniref:extracellular solute-binding protein n=1 Tax=Elusimicrobium simillimum TaxID=3143438 RepID=UPI003C6F33E2